MKSAEIKDISTKDLQERIETEKAQLAKLKVQHAVSPVENPSIIKKNRRDIEILEKSVSVWLSATRWRKPLWLQ